jgi:putative DNA primase/helicase
MSDDTVMDAALRYAALGWPVFALHYPVRRVGKLCCSCGNPACSNAAKHPYGRLAPDGCKNATTDERKIRRWFAGAPFNIGIATGAKAGFIVLDVDPRNGGDETLAALEGQHGPLPWTWRFRTGGGGEHILFRHPGGLVKNNVGTALGNGLDIKADGGFIVAPPSAHISGRHYAADVDHAPDDGPLADLPTWLTERLRTNRQKMPIATIPETWRKLARDGVVEGQRNDAVARLAGLLLRPGPIDPFVVLDLIRSWNAQRCKPPLADNEIVRTVESICGRELARRQGAANEQ